MLSSIAPAQIYRHGAKAIFRHGTKPLLCNNVGVLLNTKTRSVHTQGQYEPKTEDIRNIGIIAHVDAGKTTTTERMLYFSGLTRHLGNVDQGSTVTDYLPAEQERKITIQSAAITLHWPPLDTPGKVSKTINLIDTPGHQDFRFEVERCIPILDGAVCIIDGVKGVEAHTERVWASAQEYRIPRIIFVNKLDRDGASFKKSVTDIASRLNVWPLVCQLPLWHGDDFVGVIDVIRRAGIRWTSTGNKSINVPESTLKEDEALWQEIETARARLIEKLCEHDDELLEEFVELGDGISADSIRKSIRKLIMDGSGAMAPVFVGASLRNLGVQPLMDAVVDYLPHPGQAHSPEATLGGKKFSLESVISSAHDKRGPPPQVGTVAVVFKVVNDPIITTKGQGMLSFVRVYHGALRKNTQLWNSNLGAFERPITIKQISAAKVTEIPHISAGQIGAMTGLRKARTGDTLLILPGGSHGSSSTSIKHLKVRPPEVSPPVAFLSVEPYTVTGGKQIETALEELSREDPSLRWYRDEKTDAIIISGMGKLHLEIAVDRLRRSYKVEGLWGTIQVEYKECLNAPTGSHTRHYDKNVANKPGQATCIASIEPIDQSNTEAYPLYSRERDGNTIYFDFKQEAGDKLPFDPDTICDKLYNGAVSALSRGPRRGSPMHGCAVTLEFDHAKHYFGADSEGQIVMAARLAVKTALEHAHANGAVSVLEPVMKTNILVPEEHAGAVQHDISSARGGHVQIVRDADNNGVAAEGLIDLEKVYIPPDPYEMRQSLRDPKKGITRMLEIVANIPLKEALDYDNHLRSKTGGRHSISMAFETFMKVSAQRAKHLE